MIALPAGTQEDGQSGASRNARRFTGPVLGPALVAPLGGAHLNVRRGLGRLRDIQQVSLMLEHATLEVCALGAFDRALLFGVEGSELHVVSACFTQRPDWALEILELARQQPPRLKPGLVETEILRTRCAATVLDASKGHGLCPALIAAMRTTSYAIAPVMCSATVIGFIYADRYFERQLVDDRDLNVLWTFAEGFSYAFERLVLADRLEAQYEQISRLMSSADAVMRESRHTRVELKHEDHASPIAQAAAGLFVAPDPVMGNLLTAREREVFQLLARGASNSQIATRLVITEGTVKSHVKHILRKLNCANRAAAVSRYLAIVERDARLAGGPSGSSVAGGL